MAAHDSKEAPAAKSVFQHLNEWGSSRISTSTPIEMNIKNPYANDLHPPLSLSILPPPSLLATLITALHARPLQPLPLVLFTPPLLFSSYLNLSGYPTASAGLSAAWSGLYALLALRRRQSLRAKLTVRGLVRAAAVGLGTANAVAGGWAYFHGSMERDSEARLRRNRWGQYSG